MSVGSRQISTLGAFVDDEKPNELIGIVEEGRVEDLDGPAIQSGCLPGERTTDSGRARGLTIRKKRRAWDAAGLIDAACAGASVLARCLEALRRVSGRIDHGHGGKLGVTREHGRVLLRQR